MKKEIIALFLSIILLLNLTSQLEFAKDTLNYILDPSTKIVNLIDGEGNFKITVPTPSNGCAGVSIDIRAPKGVELSAVFSIEGVEVGTSDEYIFDPKTWDNPATGGKEYRFEIGVLSDGNPILHNVLCTIKIEYDGSTQTNIEITKIKQTIRITNEYKITDAEVLESKAAETIVINPAGNIGPTTFTISVTVNPENAGIVYGGKTYESGEQARLYFEKNEGFEFAGWYEDGTKIEAGEECTFPVTGDRTLEARFTGKATKNQFRINAVPVPSSGGSVNGDGVYDEGKEAKLIASPNSGYQFDGWYEGGARIEAKAEFLFTVEGERTLEARFSLISGNNYRPTGSSNPGTTEKLDISDPETPQGLLLVPKADENGDYKGYINGYPDNTIRAESNITRYEAAVMFYNLISESDKALHDSSISKFSDVYAGQWYSEAVGYLTAASIIKGYPDGTFKGGNHITRAEFVTLASNFSEWDPTGAVPFPDVADSHWAYSYIRSAYKNNLLTGYPDGTFGPERNIIRAETFVVVNKILGWDAASVTDGTVDFSDLTSDKWYYRDIVLAVNGKQS